MNVSVIGACGHVGLPFSLVIASAGHKVYGIDIVHQKIDLFNAGKISFIEKNADALLKDLRAQNKIEFTNDPSVLHNSDVIAIMIGTPVDSENNPRLDDILNFVEMDLIPTILYKKQNKMKVPLIILRSTVSPGTTDVIRDFILKSGVNNNDFILVYSPERVAQGNGIEESKRFPQLIGCESEEDFNAAKSFFESFIDNKCIKLKTKEAEIGKLITNMYRYVNFALANEFYMIAQKIDVDIHKVIESCNLDYPRMHLPLPGPNVGGPCLYKDGKFLLTDIPFAELINVSFNINEGMPDYIYSIIKEKTQKQKNIRVLILGGAFKAENDDTRNSLSFKLKKVLKKNGCDGYIYDPYIYRSTGKDKYTEKNDVFNSIESQYLKDFDVVVVMTPHNIFKDFISYNKDHLANNTLIIDIWKKMNESVNTVSGVYFI